MMRNDLTPFDLPGLLSEIANLIDVDTALRVAQAKGGLLAIFARNPSPQNWLVKAVGMEKARRIGQYVCEDTSYERLPVPMGINASRGMKWRRVKQLKYEGYPRQQIAKLTGMDHKTVQRLLNGKRTTFDQVIAQGDLFDKG
jgi:hypothetical protein